MTSAVTRRSPGRSDSVQILLGQGAREAYCTVNRALVADSGPSPWARNGARNPLAVAPPPLILSPLPPLLVSPLTPGIHTSPRLGGVRRALFPSSRTRARPAPSHRRRRRLPLGGPSVPLARMAAAQRRRGHSSRSRRPGSLRREARGAVAGSAVAATQREGRGGRGGGGWEGSRRRRREGIPAQRTIRRRGGTGAPRVCLARPVGPAQHRRPPRPGPARP